MRLILFRFLFCAILVAVVGGSNRSGSLWAQALGPSLSGPFELAEGVQLDQADGPTLAQWERVKSFLADGKWNDAIDTLLQLQESPEEKLLAVAPHRYLGVRDYCQIQFASLPPEALKLYRSRVDRLSETWYRRGEAERDIRLLSKVVEQTFAGTWGDRALLALGDLAFESGDFATARGHWERILPVTRQPADQAVTTPPAWLAYPDSSLDPASIRARLVLASVLEGDRERAKEELQEFRHLHKDARGWLAGHECVFSEELSKQVAEMPNRPARRASVAWTTFAGSPTRNAVASFPCEEGSIAWRLPFSSTLFESPVPSQRKPVSPSFHPVLLGDLAFFNTSQEIQAVRIATGKPAFGNSAVIFQDPQAKGDSGNGMPSFGKPRFTMTIHSGKLFAWIGSQMTHHPLMDPVDARPGSLVCLDLKAEGRLLWKISPEEGWTFDGTPVVDDRGVYVAMRRNDIRPQAYVACFDPQTGHRLWRRFVASAETPSRGVLRQYSHNLLTLFGERIFVNTNLGAVASLSTLDGHLHWVSLYPRSRRIDWEHLEPHWNRDLNPCLYDRGRLYVAPADSPRIFALDAGNGQIVWQTGTELEEATNLLGVTDDSLLASGGRLYWLAIRGPRAGHVTHLWPDSNEKPGFGCGILTDRLVVWPTRDKIYLFNRQTAVPEKVLDLQPLGITGGNVFLTDQAMIIASANELTCLQAGRKRPEKEVKE